MGYRHQNPLAAHCIEADFGSVTAAVAAENTVAEPVDFAALQAVEADPIHLAVEAVPSTDWAIHLERDHRAFALRH